jgi:iron complex outermembrane recepter protein
MRICVAARVAASVILLSSASVAWAQEPQPEVSPEPAPPADTTTLPEVVVEAPAQEQAAPKQKKKQAAPSSQGASQSAGAPPAGTAGVGERQPETAYGPFNGYAATRSASGTKTDTPLTEIPQSITVIGEEQMRDQNAQTLQETVRYSAGVTADAYGLDSRADSVFVRGILADKFIDGMRQTYGSYTGTIPVEPYMMERIEILRGPASVLYGQASVGGILNLVTKRPQEIPSGEITFEYGNFDYKQVKFDSTGALTEDGKWLYRVVAVGREADTQVDYVENDRLLFAPSITYRPTNATSITLLTSIQNDDSGSTAQFLPQEGTLYPGPNGRIPVSRFIGEPGFDRYDTESKSATLLIDHKFNDALSFHQGLRYTDTHNVYATHYPAALPVAFAPETPFLDAAHREVARVKFFEETESSIFISDTNLQAKFETGPVRHTVLGGVDYSRYSEKSWGDTGIVNYSPFGQPVFDIYDPVYGQPNPFVIDPTTLAFKSDLEIALTDDLTHTQVGIYVQDQIRVGNWIALVGLRQDWASNKAAGDPEQKSDSLTGRVGLMYEFPLGFTPYVSYAESFTPLVGERLFGGGYAQPKEGKQWEAGVKYETPGGEFLLTSAVFDIIEDGRLSPSPVPNESFQNGEAGIRGFEIEGKGQINRNIQAIASYSYTDAEYLEGVKEGYQIESVAKHQASLWAIYTFDSGELEGFSIGGGVRYVGPSWDGVDNIKTPSHTLYDAMVAYETDVWRWSLNAKNLTDEYYLTTCLSRGDCFIGTARTITTGFTYKF